MKKTVDNFRNEPCLDFREESNGRALRNALEQIRAELGKEYPLLIGEETIYTEDKLTSINPGNLDQVVGYVSKADKSLAEKALNAATETFKSWSGVPALKRAEFLFRAAELFRQKRHQFSAWMIFEAGKNYPEADAEVAEAIDFLEWYGRCMLELDTDEHRLIPSAQEINRMRYIPLGVGFIVPPWNFPLAICVGLTVSAVVSGNTVLLKPSSLTSIIAYQFVELMKGAGLPPGVINFVPGNSEEIGDYITGHHKTRFVSFTGSKETGLHINKLIGQMAPGQKWLKRLNAEMGGKDGIVVDETADLDAAAEAIAISAFGYQGQKCSAGSRAIIVESVYDSLVAKVVEKTRKLKVGLPEENYPAGPVIDENAFKKILRYIAIGKEEARLVLGGEAEEGKGYYIQPTIFADVPYEARIMKEEIFGPVLSIAKVRDWKQGIEVYNDTEYGLTGSFFSQADERLDYAIANMYCGNLYLNRPCTGALVGVHPFGGFNMSGTDSKSGSYDYLKLFMQAKTFTKLRL